MRLRHSKWTSGSRSPSSANLYHFTRVSRVFSVAPAARCVSIRFPNPTGFLARLVPVIPQRFGRLIMTESAPSAGSPAPATPQLTRNEGLKSSHTLLDGTIAPTLADLNVDHFTQDDYEF